MWQNAEGKSFVQGLVATNPGSLATNVTYLNIHNKEQEVGQGVQNRPPHLVRHHLLLIHMTIQEMPHHLRGCRRQAQHAGFVEDSMMKSTVRILP